MTQRFWMPPFSMLMPGSAFDVFMRGAGIRFGWMKSHTCPCTMADGISGSPDPACQTCVGRGIYWDTPVQFTGFVTYMHTSSAPDEPGVHRDTTEGLVQRAEPTLTIPFQGAGGEHAVWENASTFDAYVEYDAPTRFNTVLVSGGQTVLPYQNSVQVTGVSIYDRVTKTSVPIVASDYTVQNGSVILSPDYPPETAYTVEYFALPVYVAYRDAGGLVHARPFGGSQGTIPKRFRIMTLDLWTRATQAGDGPMGGVPPPLGVRM